MPWASEGSLLDLKKSKCLVNRSLLALQTGQKVMLFSHMSKASNSSSSSGQGWAGVSPELQLKLPFTQHNPHTTETHLGEGRPLGGALAQTGVCEKRGLRHRKRQHRRVRLEEQCWGDTVKGAPCKTLREASGWGENAFADPLTLDF